MEFNLAPAVIMHVDLNSCFATVEQQANPLFRGKPLVVAAYTTGNGCILAASKEAKLLGIKTGMQVYEGKQLYKNLIVLPSDPNKYRLVNHKLTALLNSYTDQLRVESIDEMVLSLAGTPALFRHTMKEIAMDIKNRIRKEIGDWLTVSIGISTNRYLAKVASGLQKPDGLVRITKENIETIFTKLRLEDLIGIKEGNAARLRSAEIMSPLGMLDASPEMLVQAFHSITGFYWWQRLHGFDNDNTYEKPKQKSFGQSYALPKPYTPSDQKIWQILFQLVMKMGKRLRLSGMTANGVGVSLVFRDNTYWHTQKKFDHSIFSDSDFYKRIRIMLSEAPQKGVRILAVYTYDLKSDRQLSLFPEENNKRNVTVAIDTMQERFGDFIITPGRMIGMEPASTQRGEQKVLDRISFGRVL